MLSFLKDWMQHAGDLPGHRYASLDTLDLLDTRIDSEDENCALFTGCDDLSRCDIEGCVDAALAFFRGRPHFWPVPDLGSVSDRLISALQRAGGRRGDDMWVMSAVTRNEGTESERICAVDGSYVDAKIWAESSWRGFGADDAPLGEYVEHVTAMSRSRHFTLLSALAEDGSAAACGALARGDAPGIFYVSTVPEHRRKGYAKEVVEALLRRASKDRADRVSLLSTRDGRELYGACGFDTVCRAHVFVF